MERSAVTSRRRLCAARVKRRVFFADGVFQRAHVVAVDDDAVAVVVGQPLVRADDEVLRMYPSRRGRP